MHRSHEGTNIITRVRHVRNETGPEMNHFNSIKCKSY